MTEVRFYHLTRASLEDALPTLLEKTCEKGWRAVVLTSSDERTEALAQLLWTYKGESFLPHGTKKDGFAADQPIWITSIDENPNKAQVLFLTDGADSADLGAYELVCDVFDGGDEAAVQRARTRWKTSKNQGFDVSYWQQESRGWSRK